MFTPIPNGINPSMAESAVRITGVILVAPPSTTASSTGVPDVEARP